MRNSLDEDVIYGDLGGLLLFGGLAADDTVEVLAHAHDRVKLNIDSQVKVRDCLLRHGQALCDGLKLGWGD